MSASARETTRGLVPWGLLGLLVLMLASERYVARRSLDFTRPEYWDWKLSGHAARHKAPKCQVLCFGTSRVQQALVPQVIQERSGLRAWNLSSCWGQAPAYYYLLRRALAAGAKPSAVIVEYHPQCLAGDYWQAVRFWPELLGPREGLDLAWTARDAEFLATTVLAHWFPSIRDRFQIRTNVLAALRGETAGDLAWTTLTIVRNKNKNRGALVASKNSKYQGDIAIPMAAGFLPESWTCDPVNEVYIRRLLDLAQARGITVYWLIPPVTPALQARREQKGLDALYTQFARGFLDRYANLVVLDAQRSGYGASVFLDPAHLDRLGACTLSADVGDLLRARAGSEPGGAGSHCPPIGNARPVSRWRTSPNRRSPWYSGGRGDEARIEMQTLEGAEALGIAWRARAGRGSRVEAGPARRRVRGRQRGVLAFERIGGPLCEAERDPLFRHQPVETRGAASRDRTPARQAGGQPRGFQWSRLGQLFTPEAPAARGITVGGPPDRLPGSVARPRTSTRTGGGLTYNMRFWPELLDLRDGLDLSWSARDAGFFATVMLSRTLPSYRCRFEIRASILAALQGRSASTQREVKALRRNWASTEGLMSTDRTRVPESVGPGRRDVGSSPPRSVRLAPWCTQQSGLVVAAAVPRPGRRARDHGLLAHDPLSPEEQAARDQNGVDDSLTRMARLARSYSRDVIVLDGCRSGYARWSFADKDHLDLYGAVTFSTGVAAIVGRSLSHPESVARWNILPASRYREPDVPIEDLKGSMIAFGVGEGEAMKDWRVFQTLPLEKFVFVAAGPGATPMALESCPSGGEEQDQTVHEIPGLFMVCCEGGGDERDFRTSDTRCGPLRAARDDRVGVGDRVLRGVRQPQHHQ